MASNLYIVGNTGVGKTWVCNCLLGKWEFESKRQADSCTREVSFVETWIPTSYEDKNHQFVRSQLPFRLFNIPGLLEADPIRVQQNVKLLQSALDRKEASITLYVLTTEGGRVRDSDYAAFKALSEAYDLHQTSFGFLVNKCSPHDNREEIVQYIHKMMGIYHVSFLPHYDLTDKQFQEEIELLGSQVRPIIVDMIRYLTVAPLHKIQELKLEADHIRDLKRESRENRIRFEQELNQLRSENNQIQKENVSKTNELANVRQALYAAQNANQNRRSGGAFRLGPLSIEW